MDILALVSKSSSLREVSKWRHSKDVKKIRRDKSFPENRTLRGAMGEGRGWKMEGFTHYLLAPKKEGCRCQNSTASVMSLSRQELWWCHHM